MRSACAAPLKASALAAQERGVRKRHTAACSAACAAPLRRNTTPCDRLRSAAQRTAQRDAAAVRQAKTTPHGGAGDDPQRRLAQRSARVRDVALLPLSERIALRRAAPAAGTCRTQVTPERAGSPRKKTVCAEKRASSSRATAEHQGRHADSPRRAWERARQSFDTGL